jgi:hypothetical protein
MKRRATVISILSFALNLHGDHEQEMNITLHFLKMHPDMAGKSLFHPSPSRQNADVGDQPDIKQPEG